MRAPLSASAARSIPQRPTNENRALPVRSGGEDADLARRQVAPPAGEPTSVGRGAAAGQEAQEAPGLTGEAVPGVVGEGMEGVGLDPVLDRPPHPGDEAVDQQ